MNTKLKISYIALLIIVTFISCKKNQSTNIADTSNLKKNVLVDSTPNKQESNIIVFKISDFTQINDYKLISFESKELLFDKYVSDIDKELFISEYTRYTYDNLRESDSAFYIKTNYGKVKFESIDEGDNFQEFNYLSEMQLSNYKIIVMFSLDFPTTIFLNLDNYEGFTTEGEIFLAKNKCFFASISNTPDYCLFEIYRISENGIYNIVNLYSNYYQIDKICWNTNLLFETVLSNNQRNYCKIDFEKILKDFERE